MTYPRLVLHAPKAKVSGEPLRRIVGRSGFLYACGEDGKGGGYVLRLHAGPRSIKADRRYGFDAPLSDIALGPDRWVWVVGSGMCEEFSFSEDGFDVWQMDFLYNPHAGGRRVDILNGIVIAGSLLYVSGNEVVMRSRAGPVRAWEALPIPGAGILGPLWGDEDGGAYVSDKAGQIYQIAPTESAWRVVGDPIGAPIRDFWRAPDGVLHLIGRGFSAELRGAALAVTRQRSMDLVALTGLSDGTRYAADAAGPLYRASPGDGRWAPLCDEGPERACTGLWVSPADRLYACTEDGRVIALGVAGSPAKLLP